MIQFNLRRLALAIPLAGALSMSAAQAAPVTYNFAGSITSLSEMQSGGWFENVAHAELGGSHLALGEKIVGSITYDAANAEFASDLAPGAPNTNHVYNVPTFSLQYKTESGGYSFSSFPGNPGQAVTFDSPTGDSLGFQAYSLNSQLGLDLLNQILFGIGDPSGQLLSSAALPASFGSSAGAGISGIFRTTDFGSIINYSANLTSLTPVVMAVPEPETYAMMLAGLGMLGMAARRKRGGAKV
jgi:hypothetical protein